MTACDMAPGAVRVSGHLGINKDVRSIEVMSGDSFGAVCLEWIVMVLQFQAFASADTGEVVGSARLAGRIPGNSKFCVASIYHNNQSPLCCHLSQVVAICHGALRQLLHPSCLLWMTSLTPV